MDYSIFRERLRQLVNGSGKTLQDLSADLNMSTPTLSRYLSGHRTPDLPYVVSISQHFNISIDWLLGLNGDKFEIMPPEIQDVATLYSVATQDDRRVIQAVLKKYKEEIDHDSHGDTGAIRWASHAEDPNYEQSK